MNRTARPARISPLISAWGHTFDVRSLLNYALFSDPSRVTKISKWGPKRRLSYDNDGAFLEMMGAFA